MLLFFTGEEFAVRCSYDERKIPERAGFSWDPQKKRWYTHRHQTAARLRDYADESALKELKRVLIIATSPWTGGLFVPEGETPKPFQIPAARFCIERNRSYLWVAPGGGKTIIANLIVNTLETATVYICPPHLALNTEEEFIKWSAGARRIGHYPKITPDTDLLIVPDSMAWKESVQDRIKKYVRDWDRRGRELALIIDEAHRFKNEKSRRTQAVLKDLAPIFPRVTFMSGSAMPNGRPMEIFPILSHFAPETIEFRNHFDYGRKYCGGYKNEMGHWDFTGKSNLRELKERTQAPTGPFMYRIKKSELGLPPVHREMVIVGKDMSPKLAKIDRNILQHYSPEDLVKTALHLKAVASGEASEDTELHVATYRRLLGLEKVGPAVSHLEDILEDTKDSILNFGVHLEAIYTLAEKLSHHNPLVITGETPMKERHAIVKEFQGNPKRRLFIGNIRACGTGVTLTKARRVVFSEYEWVPEDNKQAEDRASRIGQTSDVLSQYLVYRNSLDKNILQTILQKESVLNYM